MRGIIDLRPQDHPRIRGEHRAARTWWRVPDGSSPHTRGARENDPGDDPRFRIIPAYAGSTPSQRAEVLYEGDHPRIRGEHRPEAVRPSTMPGSSPHTRGALAAAAAEARPEWIIPAYAGSTLYRYGPYRGT